MRTTLRPVGWMVLVLSLPIWVSACTESATQSTDVGDLDILMAPPSQDPDPEPTGVEPDSVLQATVDTVQVMGSNFLPGDRVGWLLNGRTTGDVVTQSTEFVSSGELRAIIEVAPDAEVTAFDVEVRGGGKRKGIGTDLLRVQETFNGDVVVSFRETPGDAFTSDGVNSHSAEVTSRLWLSVEEGSGRGVCVAFPAPGPDAVIHSTSDWQDLLSVSAGAVGLGQTYCGPTTLHTSDHREEDGLMGMDNDLSTTTVDDVQVSGGKLVLKEFDARGTDWSWRLIFDDFRTAVNGGTKDNGVCIRRDTGNRWTLGTDASIAATSEAPDACADVDPLVNLVRYEKKGGFTHVATFRMVFAVALQPA